MLFTCLKRNDKREVKVAQLAGSVAEHSSYHHGEVRKGDIAHWNLQPVDTTIPDGELMANASSKIPLTAIWPDLTVVFCFFSRLH